MDAPELTVIVPVYNVENYLDECIQSILKQTFRNFELILVDDGSTDKSGIICDKYAEEDNRIRVIHQNNAGVSAARNSGIRLIKGKFVSFIDADDYIDHEMFKKLMSFFDNPEVDVVVCAAAHVDNKKDIKQISFLGNRLYSRDEMVKALFNSPNPLGGVCWNKIFRWKENTCLEFKINMSFAEDLYFLFDYFKDANYCKQTDRVLYYQNIRPDSITNIDKYKAMHGIIKATGKLRDYTKKFGKEIYIQATEKYLDNCIRYFNMMKSLAKEEMTDISEIRRDIRKRIYLVLKEAIKNRLMNKKNLARYIYLLIKM